MEYMGGITEFKYNPIQQFNNQLQTSKALKIYNNEDENSFDKILETKCNEDKSPMGNFVSQISNTFNDGLNSVNDDAVKAQNAEEILASGGDISAHEVMIAAERSNLSLQMAVQIRNKLINAYTEINNMQV